MTSTDRPTPEQQDCINGFNNGQDLAIIAGAGTGKTRTLIGIARRAQWEDRRAGRPLRRGRYVAFNKAIVTDSKTKFERGELPVEATTVHKLAYASVGWKYRERMNASTRMKSIDIARQLNTGPFEVIAFDGKPRRLAPGFLAGWVMRALRTFAVSGDLEPMERHFPYVDGIDNRQAPGSPNNAALRRNYLPALRKAWADIQSLDGSLPFRQEFYLKMWHLSEPRLAASYLLFDEAQDASPVMRAVMGLQTHMQRVYVGDPYQSIYGFTGAVNALDDVSGQRAFLTQSFRFGHEIAGLANVVLGDLEAEFRLQGNPAITSHVRPIGDVPDAYLTRTNATAIQTFLACLERGLKPAIVGGGKEVKAFAEAAIDLRERGWTSHQELACFKSWGEVQEYVANDEQGDELALMVRLVDEFTAEKIIEALNRGQNEDDADVVISTAHKAKGRQWGRVKLTGDFPDPEDSHPITEEDRRLLYVAVTRAQFVVDIERVAYFDNWQQAAPLHAVV